MAFFSHLHCVQPGIHGESDPQTASVNQITSVIRIISFQRIWTTLLLLPNSPAQVVVCCRTPAERLISPIVPGRNTKLQELRDRGLDLTTAGNST